MTPTGNPKPKRADVRRVRQRLPTPAAVVAAVGIGSAAFLAVSIGFGAAEVFERWVLAPATAAGLIAGIWFFVAWKLRDPKRRRAKAKAQAKAKAKPE
ncbi:hypothetical protein [Asanoa siamensis]|uniref:Secreted protein with PEP-CTERM sorting signal n=1 Tax=Asanoa siamensis TaxID=926357 RepID=A0ABQ4CJQ2_9ACTN|nr:hypothetical protein [Asanoa siamensis]GIF71501.1 hypothetical protein Asi02nite_10190 [Asanoa siamensis]